MRLDVHTISLTVKPAQGRASVAGWLTLRLWLVVNLFTLLRTARRAIEVAQEAEDNFRVVSLALSTSVRQPRKLKRLPATQPIDPYSYGADIDNTFP